MTQTTDQERAAFEAWGESIGFPVTGKYAETVDVLCAESAFKAGYKTGRSSLTAQPAAATKAPSDENGGHRLVEPDHETALALADAPRSLRNYVAALRSALSDAQAAQVVPKGWKLVPEEPTPAMYDRVMREGYYHDDPKAVKAVLRAEYQDMLAAAPQPQEVAQLDDTNVADMAQAVDSTEPTPVQMPEPVAVAFRFETEEYGSTATSFYPSDRIGMGWTALYTEHQVRQLLATQEPST